MLQNANNKITLCAMVQISPFGLMKTKTTSNRQKKPRFKGMKIGVKRLIV